MSITFSGKHAFHQSNNVYYVGVKRIDRISNKSIRPSMFELRFIIRIIRATSACAKQPEIVKKASQV